MDQAIGPTDVDEGAIGGQAGHRALHGVADAEPAEEVVAPPGAVLILGGLLADDEPVALAVDLEDLHRDPLADQLLEVSRVGAGNLR